MQDVKTRVGSVVAVVIDEVNNSIVFNVRGAAPDGGGKSITLDLAAVHQANRDYSALHGFKQRIVDTAAMSKNPKTGQPASPADKFDAIERLVTHYNSGSPDWTIRAAATERTSGEIGLLIRAIMELKGKSLAEVRDWVESKTAAERAALVVSGAIKPLIDSYRAERAGNVDAEELLAELA